MTSAWKHPDGEIDWHCLKYPVLQEVEGTSSSKQRARDWHDTKAKLQFDLMHSGKAGERLLGRASIPVNALVTNRFGGIQDLREIETSVYDSKTRKVSTLRVRLQLKTPPVGSAFTELDRMNMVSLEEMLDDERQLGIVGRVKKVRDLAISVQDGLENIANFSERVRHLLLWTHPAKTAIVMAYIFFGVVVCYFVPFRYLIILRILKDFGKGFLHKPKSRSFNNRVRNLLSTLPLHSEMSAVYASHREQLASISDAVRRQEAARVTLQAAWSGLVWKKGTFNRAMKEVRVCSSERHDTKYCYAQLLLVANI